MCSALSARFEAGQAVVVDSFTLSEPKTKAMLGALAGLGLAEGQNVLVVLAGPDDGIQRASRNLPNVKVLPAIGVNVYDLLRHDALVLSRAGLESIVARVGGPAA